MAALSSDITDATLLCERCGYVLEGLDERGACPECGQPIAESLPSRRTGTPFQASPGWRGLVAQCELLATSPTRVFEQVRFKHPEDLALCMWSLCVASAPGAIIVLLLGALHPDLMVFSFIQTAFVAAAVFFLTVALLGTLSWIEYLGVSFFSRRRNWRVQKHVARAVCANAMLGWIPTGFFIAIGFAAMSVIEMFVQRGPIGVRPWVGTAAAAMPVLGFIAGMLVFESLVYIGVRCCKYANWVPRPEK